MRHKIPAEADMVACVQGQRGLDSRSIDRMQKSTGANRQNWRFGNGIDCKIYSLGGYGLGSIGGR